MPWAKFDDRMPSNRKVRLLSDAAFRLYVSSVCWCSEQLTDGRIATEELRIVSDVRDPETAAGELVARKLWEPVEGGWLVHDFHDYNPTAAAVLDERAKAAERQRRARDKAKSSRSQSRGQSRRYSGVTHTDDDAHANPTHAVEVVIDDERVGYDLDDIAEVFDEDDPGEPSLTRADVVEADRSRRESRSDAAVTHASVTPDVRSPRPDPTPIYETSYEVSAPPAPPLALVHSAALPATVGAPTAQTLLAEYIANVPKRPPSKVLGQLGRELAALLAENVDPDDVRNGLIAWSRKNLHPSTLPSVVNEVMNAPAAGRTATAAPSRTTGILDRAAARALAAEGVTA
ncbi:hypothetical protein ABH935_009803 [Catenulispora sp. GAS73]|uniref:hypothetical protein n=1 Tax=Catenulispora sp. GAS73 TaxID=3156269 RepID=UPI003517FA3F